MHQDELKLGKLLNLEPVSIDETKERKKVKDTNDYFDLVDCRDVKVHRDFKGEKKGMDK